LDDQRDLGTKWAPRFVRIVDALPVTGVDKVAKLPLRAESRWPLPRIRRSLLAWKTASYITPDKTTNLLKLAWETWRIS